MRIAERSSRFALYVLVLIGINVKSGFGFTMLHDSVVTRSQLGKKPIFDLIDIAPADTSSSSSLIVVLPGNPGIADFYVDMAKEIARLSKVQVCVLGWLGFSSNASGWGERPQDVCLEAQITHAKRMLTDFSTTHKSVALVGHSIGALVALDLISSFQNLTSHNPISSVVAVMPFVADNPDSEIYRKKRATATAPGISVITVMLALFLRCFPMALRCKILNLLGQPTAHMDTRARILTVDAMTRVHNLRSMLHMGISEFRSPRITNGPDTSWYEYASKVGVIYASGNDAWVTRNHAAEMKRISVRTCTIDSDHDVCTRIDTSKSCAKAVTNMLLERGFLRAPEHDD